MVIGLFLMYFTKNDRFSIIFFVGILLAGVSIVIGLLGEKKPKYAPPIEPVPEPKEEVKTDPIGDFIDGKVLEVRKFVDKIIYLIECKLEVFKPGDDVRVSPLRAAIQNILDSKIPVPILSQPLPEDEISTVLKLEE